MLKTILLSVLGAAVVLLVLLWFIGGGASKVGQDISAFPSFSWSAFLNAPSFFGGSLPWQPAYNPIPNPALAEAGGEDQTSGDTSSNGQTASQSAEDFGTPSPDADQLSIEEGTALTQDPNAEYIILRSDSQQSIDISGWSLQSALTKVRVFLPQAAQPFISGRVNVVAPIELAPGGVIYVVSGASPVGVSFQENSCTGYLGTLQRFVPGLPQSCPAPSQMIPDTPQNEAALGASCFSYIDNTPSCSFPAQPPSSLSAACIAALQSTLSYNGCVNAYQGSAGFAQNSWRVYLGEATALWNSQHDVIRLLDSDGRIVATLTY